MGDYGPGIWASCSSENSGMMSYAVSKNLHVTWRHCYS